MRICRVRQRYERIEEGLGVWVLNKGVQAAAFFEAIQVCLIKDSVSDPKS